MTRPKLLDLFCCEGGASRGYDVAGFDVYGVDLFKHEDAKGRRVGFSRDRYPYPAEQSDVLLVLDALLAGRAGFFTPRGADPGTGFIPLGLSDFDAIHASPPCQHASAGTRAMRAHGDDRHPALIEPTRELLIQTGLPYVIENVKGAALRDPVTLCWSMFHDPATFNVRNEDGVLLRMERHRLFESNIPLGSRGRCRHPADVQVAGAYGAAQRTIAGAKRRGGGYVPPKAIQARLLGTPWMTEAGMHQCIPPVYTEWVGAMVLRAIEAKAAA